MLLRTLLSGITHVQRYSIYGNVSGRFSVTRNVVLADRLRGLPRLKANFAQLMMLGLDDENLCCVVLTEI